jgi:hypothetical protein
LKENALLETHRVIKLTRKELDRLEVDDWAKEAVVNAAEWTVMRTPDYLHASIQSQVTLCGKTIASVLKDEDKPALFVPADIVTDTGNQTGVILNTDSGAVFGWTEGRFRLSYFAMTIPHTVVRELSTLGPSDDYNASLNIAMDDGSLEVHFAAVRSEDGQTGLLDGIVASLKGESQQ